MRLWTSFVLATMLLLVLALPVLARNDRTPVTICHKPGTPAEHTLVVDDNALRAHLAHGDYLGPCVAQPTDAPTVTPTGSIGEPVSSFLLTIPPTDVVVGVSNRQPSDANYLPLLTLLGAISILTLILTKRERNTH